MAEYSRPYRGLATEAGTRLSDPARMQGYVDLKAKHRSRGVQPVPMVAHHMTVAINTIARGEIRTWVLSRRSRTR